LFTLLITRLKKSFPNFFKSEKKRIYIICSLLILSLVSRIGFQAALGIESFKKELYDSRTNDTWLILSPTFVEPKEIDD